MNKLCLILATTTILAGCATNSGSAPVAVADTPQAADAAPVPAAAPKPQLGSFGFDQAGMDTTAPRQ